MNATRTITTALTVATLAWASPLMAQESSRFPQPLRSPNLSYHHASTFAEGYLRGRADLSRGLGEYNYNTALATLVLEEARSRAYDNRVQRVETFVRKRQINRAYRESLRPRRPSTAAQARINPPTAPARLTGEQWDAATGTLHWPTVLLREEFDECREQLDGLICQRSSSDGGLGSKSYGEIRKAAARMKSILDQQLRQDAIDGPEFGVANKFIKALEHEARFASST